MSLFFEERINEQEEDDPKNDMITFIFPWIFELPPLNENNEDCQYICEKEIITSYHVCGFEWHLKLKHDTFIVHPSMGDGWLKTCNVSYNLYSDNDMHHELYSSPKISARFDLRDTEYRTPNGFLTKFNNAYQKREIAKMVIFVELILFAKTFLCPFELRSNFLYGDVCMEYPEDIENDFRFEFMKYGDYTIKCSDGYSMPALKMVLNVSSKFMHNHFKESKENEFICEHKIDVVKSIIIFLHSLCFQMPKTYDLDFADRLLKAIDFFEPGHTRGQMGGTKKIFFTRHISCLGTPCPFFRTFFSKYSYFCLVPQAKIFYIFYFLHLFVLNAINYSDVYHK